MGQPHLKREFSKSSSDKVVNFNFSQEDISFDKLKKIREEIELKENKQVISLAEIAAILKVRARRVEGFCFKNNIKFQLRYYDKTRRFTNIFDYEDAEFIIKNFK